MATIFCLHLRRQLASGAPLPLAIERQGLSLVVNGEAFDFTPMQEGDVLERAAIEREWCQGFIAMEAGVIDVPVLFQVEPGVAPGVIPETVYVHADGPVDLPSQLRAELEEAA